MQSPVKQVYAGASEGPVILRRGEEVFGIIYRLRELVETHSFAASPFPIGQLLKNAVLASQLARGCAQLEGAWYALRSYSGELIALLSATESLALPGLLESLAPIAA